MAPTIGGHIARSNMHCFGRIQSIGSTVHIARVRQNDSGRSKYVAVTATKDFDLAICIASDTHCWATAQHIEQKISYYKSYCPRCGTDTTRDCSSGHRYFSWFLLLAHLAPSDQEYTASRVWAHFRGSHGFFLGTGGGRQGGVLLRLAPPCH